MKITLGNNLKCLLAGVAWVWLTIVAPLTASAQSTWADTGTAWNVAANWNPNGVPAVSSTVIFNEATYVNQPVFTGAGLGAGNLQFLGAGTINSTESGTANFNMGNVGGQIFLASGAGPVTLGWKLTLAGTTTFTNASANTLVLSNTGSFNLGGGGIAVLAGPGNIVFQGNIFNAGQFQSSSSFTGTATITSTNNTYFGATTLNGGTVVLNGLLIGTNTSGSLGPNTLNGGSLIVNGAILGGATNTITVNSGALGGSGLITPIVTVGANGVLAPGPNSTTIGTLTFSNSLTLSGTNTMKVSRGATPSSDQILMTNGTTVTLGGVLNIVNLGSTLQIGDSFQLINGTIAGGYSSITPATPGVSLVWDLSHLAPGGDGTLRVASGGNVPPVANNDVYFVRTNTVFSTNAPGVLLNDTDLNSDPLTAVTNSEPSHGSLTFNSNGSFSYTPTFGFIGTDSFTYRANDGLAFSGTATVTLNVGSGDHPPTATNDTYTVNRNGVLNISAPGVLSNDSDPDSDPLTAINFSSPAHGILTPNANGSFTYTPTAGFAGTDSFTYQASDGQLSSAAATVTITVQDHAPVAVNDAYGFPTNSATYSVSAPAGVLANDTDADGDTLTAAVVANPAHGALTLNSDGSFTFTPNSSFNGSDSFTYRANDGLTNSATATVTLSNTPVTWLGTSSGSWATPGNWTSGTLPNNRTVVYDNNSTAHLTETLDQNWNILVLNVFNPAGPITIQNNGFVLTNGALNLTNATQDLTILADYVSSGNVSVAANRTVTLSNILSGSVNFVSGPGTFRLLGTASLPAIDVTNSATFVIDGGSIASNPPVRLDAESGGTVTLNVTNNGSITILPSTGTTLQLGRGGNTGTPGNNVVNVASGSILISPSTTTGPNGINVPGGPNCTGTFNLNGGLVVLTNQYTSDVTNAGETRLQIPNNATGVGVVNLNGGTLIVPSIAGTTPTTGSGTLNFNGTIVTANRPNSGWITNVQNAFVQTGGAIFDTAGFEVTITETLQAGSPSGGLIKRGNGTLHLTGLNSYTGTTLVTNGTLTVTATPVAYPFSSPLVVNSATFSADVSGGGTVSIPSANLNSAVVSLNFGSVAGNDPTSPAIDNNLLGGHVALTASGVNTINISGSGFTTGDVPLITYTTSIGGAGFGSIHLGTLPLGMSATLVNDTVNQVIVLHITHTPNTLTWFGDKSANWDTTTLNWNGGTTSYSEVGGVGDNVTFDDSLNGSPLRTNINLTTTLSPLSVFANNGSVPYRFSGPGKLSGAGSLTMMGGGALTLATVNDYTGGSFLTNGTVYLANNNSLGAGPVAIAGVTLSSDGNANRTITNDTTIGLPFFTFTAGFFGDNVNTGAVVLAGTVSWGGAARTIQVNNNLIFSGTLTNGGMDIKTGPGTVTFQGATDASTLGNMQIEDGSVVVSSGTLTRSHGGIRIMENGSATQRASFSVLNGASALLDGSGVNMRIGNTNADPSGINVVDVFGTLSCTTNDPTGAIQIGTNSALSQLNVRGGGLVRVGSITPTGVNSEVDLFGGTLAGMTNQTTYMQGLGNCFVRNGGVIVSTLGPTNQALNLTIGQSLLDGTGGGGLTKSGAGTLTLTGTNTYTGATVVSAGTLQLSGGIQPQSGLISVSDGAILGFQPKAAATLAVGAVTVGSSTGAGLSATVPGAGNPTVPLASVSTLTLNGTVTVSLQGTSLSNGLVPVISYSSIAGSGTLALGTLPTNIVATITNDTTLKLIEINITSTNGAVVLLPPGHFATTVSGTNLIFSATNGTPNAPVELLQSTNLNTPLSNWTHFYSNVLDGSGNFRLTNGINPTVPRQFYILQIP